MLHCYKPEEYVYSSAADYFYSKKGKSKSALLSPVQQHTVDDDEALLAFSKPIVLRTMFILLFEVTFITQRTGRICQLYVTRVEKEISTGENKNW
jgi:hypothetical protein